MVISLDVIYHLVEDDVFVDYMKQLFESSDAFVIIYSSNIDKYEPQIAPHVKQRKFTDWIEKNVRDFRLLNFIPNKYPFDGVSFDNTSISDFYIYQKVATDR